jgi:hypothetical protein
MNKLSISPKKVALILTIIVLSLTAAHILGQYYKNFVGNDAFLLKIVDKVDLDGESNNLPNWYQSSALLFSSFLLAIIAVVKKAEEDANVRHWAFLALTFVYLSLDELVSIHEQATVPLRHAFDLHGVFYLSWVIPAAILLAVFLVLYLKFLWRLPSDTRWLLIAAGAIYVFGAVGVEMIDAKFLELHEVRIMDSAATGSVIFQYALMTAVEEFFEMAGIVTFIYALLSYIVPEAVSTQLSPTTKPGRIRETNLVLSEPAVVRASAE